MPFAIDDELAAFLVDGNSLTVATRDAALVPHATRACGIRVTSPSTIDVLLPRATSTRAIENVRDNGAIAVSVSSPRNFRTVQLKGRGGEPVEASLEDLAMSRAQLVALTATLGRHGWSRQKVRNFWLFDSWRMTVVIEEAFLQTPGPGAGAPLRIVDGR